MPLKLYDSTDAVPEALRASAIETKDGKFAVDEPADPALGDAGKKALQAERDARAAAEATAAAEKKRADDLQRAADAKAKGISEDELQKIRDAEATARKPIEDENTKLKAELRKVQLHDKVQEKLLAAGVMPDRIAKAMRDLSPGPDGRVDLTDDGAGMLVRDAKGNVTAETIDDFVTKTYKAESPFFYAGTNASGSGAEGGAGGADSTGYDPVKAGKAAAAEQKKTAAENQLAFK